MPFKRKLRRHNKSVYRSGFEVKVANNLEERGIEYEYEKHKLKYIKKDCPHCGEVVEFGIYTPDFVIERSSGVRLVVESKGFFPSIERTKMQNVKRCNPEEDIRFLFYRDQPIRKGSKRFYSHWAVKNGFKYTIGSEIPQEWITEA